MSGNIIDIVWMSFELKKSKTSWLFWSMIGLDKMYYQKSFKILDLCSLIRIFNIRIHSEIDLEARTHYYVQGIT